MHSDGRNHSIDLLRVAGGLVVMSAHVALPPWLFQLRNFGAPMLVVVSALATQLLHGQRALNAGAFLRRRLPKLTLQPWAFLAIFFLCAEAMALVKGRPFPFSREEVINSFTFSGGIGYLWIFRVYILVALITPPLLSLYRAAPSMRAYLTGVELLYAGAELARIVLHAGWSEAAWRAALDEIVFTPLPYALLFAYGLALPKLSDAAVRRAALAAAAVFAALASWQYAATGAFVPTQAQKYPPTAYYLAYAFACIHLVYLALRHARLPVSVAPVIAWLSSHLLWIYLWHVFALFAWATVVGHADEPSLKSALELTVVVAVAMVATWMQFRMLRWWRRADLAARLRAAGR